MADDPTISLADLLIVIQKARQFLSEPFVGALFLMALLQLVGFKGRAGERGASLAGRVRGSVECFREALHALTGRIPSARFEGARSVTLSPVPADGASSDDRDDDSSAAEEDGDGDCDSVDSSNVGDLQEERVRAEADELADTIALPRQSRNAAKWHFRDHTGSLLPRFGVENQGPRDQDSMSSRASSAASPVSTRAQKRRRDDDADSDDSDDDADCGDGSDSDGNSSEQSAGSKVMRMDDFA
ncbi:hypothetical protein FNF27_05135 [Cafeteria roenbergensis]|uniref:Uncharacterized protein n=1 Tax=Cafeteria roenbergensis TaxID=33653 RepID=A0A5A8E7S7_CAFRO|nr:hypothetical protein FNF27_05135 [Cafeteria roenbergensis]